MAENFFCRKRRLAILLVIIVVFFATKTYAVENPGLKKSSNAIYQVINDHEYLLVPLSDAAAGLLLCGPWCALAGGLAGVGEEALIYYGYIDKRYLTYGILGGAIGHMFNKALTTTGIVSGFFFAGGFESNEEMIVPSLMLVLGNQAEGIYGIVLSVVGCIADQSLSESDVAKKYPVTTLILIPKFLNKVLGTGMSIITTLYLNIFIYNPQAFSDALKFNIAIGEDIKRYIRIAVKSYDNYDKLIPQDEIDDHLEKSVISLIGGQLLVHWLITEKILLNQKLVYLFEHLDQTNIEGVAGNPFVAGGIKLVVFLVPWVAGQAVTNCIEKYYDDRLSVILKNNIQEKLYDGENLLRLSNHENFSVYMDNLNQDVATVTNYGSFLFNSAISTSVSGAYGASMIVIHSRSLLFYTFVYEMLSSLVMQVLSSQSMIYDDEIKSLNSNLLDLYKDSKEHVRTIVERGGIDITGDKIQEISTALIDSKSKENSWYMVLKLYLSADKVLGTILNYYLVGKEIQQGRLPFEKRNLLRKALMDESDMFSWAGRNLATAGQIERSLDRLIVLVGIIDAPPSNVDQIQRSMHGQNQLVLHDLEVGVGDRLLVTVDDLKFVMGKVYAITGKTGCGKTSFLSKIKGLKENGIYGKGKIYYPKIKNKDPKIIMLSQQDYFPINSSLKEILSYPDKFPNDPDESIKLKKEMSMILKEMGLSRFLSPDLNLDSKENWYTLLSGGEKKKMIIISAIIKKPDILILDEIFNGLDSESIATVQQVLKKYLPHALILSVDHHAKNNNHAGFYDEELHFHNKQINSSPL